MEVSDQIHAPTALASGKESRLEIRKEAWCVHSQFERRDDENVTVYDLRLSFYRCELWRIGQ
jgi:hypothetical protein